VTTTYKVVSIRAATEQNLPLPDWMDEEGYGIWRFEDDTAVEFLNCDGGEPEDNSFIRDGSWIAPALQAAYELGRSGG
jgi:hypothetical protein